MKRWATLAAVIALGSACGSSGEGGSASAGSPGGSGTSAAHGGGSPDPGGRAAGGDNGGSAAAGGSGANGGGTPSGGNAGVTPGGAGGTIGQLPEGVELLAGGDNRYIYATGIVIVGDTLWMVTGGGALVRMPKAGGQLVRVADVNGVYGQGHGIIRQVGLSPTPCQESARNRRENCP